MESLTQLLQKLRDDRHLYDGDSVNRMLDRCIELSKDKGWISVQTKLPPINTEVLVALENCSIPATGQYTKIGKGKGMGWLLPSECHADGSVTHWMSLPDPPTR